MPGPGRTGRGQRPVRGPRATAEHGRQPGVERIVDLLGADEMDMGIEPARGEDLPLPRNRLRAGADDDIDARLRIRVPRLADPRNRPVLQTHIRLVDPRMVDDQRIRNDRIDSPARAGHLGLTHPVPDHLPAPELHLLAIGGQITLHLDPELGIREPHLVAGGGAEHVGIGFAGDLGGHGLYPILAEIFSTANAASEANAQIKAYSGSAQLAKSADEGVA